MARRRQCCRCRGDPCGRACWPTGAQTGRPQGAPLQRHDNARAPEGGGGVPKPRAARSHRPGVNHEGVVLAVQENEIEHIERIDRSYSGNKRRLAVTVKRLQRKAARIDLAAFAHELGELIVEVLVARKRFVAEFRKAALDAEGHAGSIEEDRGFEALALEAQRLKHVHEANRTFEGDGMKGNEGFLARLGLDVLKHLLFVVDQIVALLMSDRGDSRHVPLLARELANQTPFPSLPRSRRRGREETLTQNSKGCANGWIAYPFINADHFTINNTVN